MNKKIVISLLLIGVMAFGAGLGTFAWFTSEAKSEANIFKTGTLAIEAPGSGQMVAGIANIDNIYPNWQGEKTITVKNIGSLPFIFRLNSITKTAGDDILYAGGTNDTGLEVSVDNGTTWTDINQFVGSAQLGGIVAAATKDSTGTLVPTEETFKIMYRLPSAANDDFQNKSATLQFNFLATQTENTTWAQ